MGLVAPRHVGSSWTRARTRVPCTGRQILNHCATREVLEHCIFVVALKSDSVNPPTFFYFCETVLAIIGPFHFIINFRISLSATTKGLLNFWLELEFYFNWFELHWICTSMWQNWYLHNIEPSNPWTWYLSPTVCVIFDFFHQHLIVFGVHVFCLFR